MRNGGSRSATQVLAHPPPLQKAPAVAPRTPPASSLPDAFPNVSARTLRTKRMVSTIRACSRNPVLLRKSKRVDLVCPPPAKQELFLPSFYRERYLLRQAWNSVSMKSRIPWFDPLPDRKDRSKKKARRNGRMRFFFIAQQGALISPVRSGNRPIQAGISGRHWPETPSIPIWHALPVPSPPVPERRPRRIRS